jgi:hypothetical protein
MAKDIIHTDLFYGGDFNIDFSDRQHVADILVAQPGHYKNAPGLGVGIANYAGAPLSPQVIAELQREIKMQLEADGGKNVKIKIDLLNQIINADATY